MPQTVEDVMDAALGLSEADRAELAERLAASLPTPSAPRRAGSSEFSIGTGRPRALTREEVQRLVKAYDDAGGPAPGPLSSPVAQEVLMSPASTSGAKMALLLESLAAMGGSPEFGEPMEWQREVRKDRPLPGREE